MYTPVGIQKCYLYYRPDNENPLEAGYAGRPQREHQKGQ